MLAAIVQARMGATRLPGKILLPAAGKPLLLHLLERLSHLKKLEKVIVATTIEKADDPVAELAQARGYPVFRGSENDVLDRYYQTAKQFGVDPIVRVTADCPLIDPLVVDRVIEQCQSGGFDHVGNGLPPTYPDGLDAEIFSFAALAQAWNEAKLPSEREHVSSYIWNHPEHFHYGNVENEQDLSHLRWTLDYPEDYELIKGIFEGLYEKPNTVFSMQDILAYLDGHPALARLNAKYARNEGYAKSMREDEAASGSARERSARQQMTQGISS